MTAELEKDMDLISERDLTKEQVVAISRDLLREAYRSLEDNRERVASKIYEGITDDRVLGECPKCGENKLRVIRSKASKKRFVGCEGYPGCDQTYPLPQRGDIIGTGEACPQCGSPKIKILGGRRPWVLCLDPYCPTKADYREKQAARAAKAAASGDGGGEVPKKSAAAKKAAAGKKAAAAPKRTASKRTAAAKKPAAPVDEVPQASPVGAGAAAAGSAAEDSSG
jgi:DNA topoisomerase-1